MFGGLKMIKGRHYLLFILLILLISKVYSVNPLNGRFMISTLDTPISPTSTWQIGGEYTDLANPNYTVDSIKVGDMIGDANGKLFRIDSIIEFGTQSYNYILTDATYISGAIYDYDLVPAYMQVGTLFHPTVNGFPMVTYDPENVNSSLQISVQNAATIAKFR